MNAANSAGDDVAQDAVPRTCLPWLPEIISLAATGSAVGEGADCCLGGKTKTT